MRTISWVNPGALRPFLFAVALSSIALGLIGPREARSDQARATPEQICRTMLESFELAKEVRELPTLSGPIKAAIAGATSRPARAVSQTVSKVLKNIPLIGKFIGRSAEIFDSDHYKQAKESFREALENPTDPLTRRMQNLERTREVKLALVEAMAEHVGYRLFEEDPVTRYRYLRAGALKAKDVGRVLRGLTEENEVPPVFYHLDQSAYRLLKGEGALPVAKALETMAALILIEDAVDQRVIPEVIEALERDGHLDVGFWSRTGNWMSDRLSALAPVFHLTRVLTWGVMAKVMVALGTPIYLMPPPPTLELLIPIGERTRMARAEGRWSLALKVRTTLKWASQGARRLFVTTVALSSMFFVANHIQQIPVWASQAPSVIRTVPGWSVTVLSMMKSSLGFRTEIPYRASEVFQEQLQQKIDAYTDAVGEEPAPKEVAEWRAMIWDQIARGVYVDEGHSRDPSVLLREVVDAYLQVNKRPATFEQMAKWRKSIESSGKSHD